MRTFAVIFALLTLSCRTTAPQTEVKDVDDIQSMERRSDGRFDVQCRDGSSETVSSGQIRAGNVCGEPTSTNPASSGVVFGNSDRCDTDDIIGDVNVTTNCEQFGNGQSVWSIRVGGECIDISDTNTYRACQLVKGHIGASIYGTDDGCDIDDIQVGIGPTFDCNTLDTNSAWSIMVYGQCHNISDTSIRGACRLAKGYLRGSAVLFGTDDGCDVDDIHLDIWTTTDCNQLPNNQSVWSIMVNGRCENIDDTDVRRACIYAKSFL